MSLDVAMDGRIVRQVALLAPNLDAVADQEVAVFLAVNVVVDNYNRLVNGEVTPLCQPQPSEHRPPSTVGAVLLPEEFVNRAVREQRQLRDFTLALREIG